MTVVSARHAGTEERPVRQIEPTAELAGFSELPEVSYQDAFALRHDRPGRRTAEQWARAVLERAPEPWRTTLPAGWASLGLRHGVLPPEESVLGWPIAHREPERLLLAAESRVGMPGELHFVCRGDTLLFSTAIYHGNLAARALWTPVVPFHQRVVALLLTAARDGARSGSAR